MQGKKRRFRTPSPATALSVVALFVSLGGVSYAAATIGSSQIKNNSVASKDIKNKTISTKDISSKARKALKGAKGPAGACREGRARRAGRPECAFQPEFRRAHLRDLRPRGAGAESLDGRHVPDTGPDAGRQPPRGHRP